MVDIHKEKILVLDFGSQYTQLIARRVRESRVYSEIFPFNFPLERIKELKPSGIILSGGPGSVYDMGAPFPHKEIFELGIPVLGICYGMQCEAHMLGGEVQRAQKREYGRAELIIDDDTDLFNGLPQKTIVWMSHGDQVKALPPGYESLASTANVPIAAFGNR